MERYGRIDNASYKLPVELHQAAVESAAELRKFVAGSESGFYIYREFPVMSVEGPEGKLVINGSDVLRFLEPLTETHTYDSAEGPPPVQGKISLSGAIGRKLLLFAELSFDQLRAMICKGKKGSLSATTHGILIAIANWLVQHLGVDPKYALPAASAILIAVMTATKGAFCQMTMPQAKAALARHRAA